MVSHSKNGWRVDRLKDITRINDCSLGTHTPKDYEFNYLEISNVDYFGVISEEDIKRFQFTDAPSRARRRVNKHDILISSVRPNLQAIAHIQNGDYTDLICSTGFNVVSPEPYRIRDRFLYYFLLSEGCRQHFDAVSKGVGYPAIDDKDFKAINVPLPPLPEQERISAYLDASCEAIDLAVETKRKQLDTLDTLRRSIIQRAVTQGLDSNVEMKESSIDWLPAIPRHWTSKKLKRHVKMVRGQFTHRPRSDPAFYGGPYPFIQTGSVSATDKYITEYSQTLNEDGLRVSRIFPSNTIVMTITGAKITEVAVTAFEACFPDSMVGFFPDHHINGDYLYYLLVAMKPALLSATFITTQPNINYVQIGGNYIPIPPIDEQVKIAKHIEKLMEKRTEVVENLNTQIVTLTAYRKSLIHDCVTGKRRISDSDVAEVEAYV